MWHKPCRTFHPWYPCIKTRCLSYHDDAIKRKLFPRYWLFVRGIHRSQRPVTRRFDVFFDLRLNKRLSKQSLGLWLETISIPLWRHRNAFRVSPITLWRYKIETFSALLALCEGNSPVADEFPPQRANNACFDVFVYVSLNKWLHKQLRAGDLRRHDGHCDVTVMKTRARLCFGWKV